jgi:hypothetical protein
MQHKDAEGLRAIVEYGSAATIESLTADDDVVALLSDPAKGGPDLVAMLTFGSEEKRTLLGCALARGNERLIRLLLAACRWCPCQDNLKLQPV